MEFSCYFETIAHQLKTIDPEQLLMAAHCIEHTQTRNGKVILAGNGGSAAIASHVAVDLTKAAKIRSINFNEADLITCFSNDYGYENWIQQALRSYADPQDTVILISSSGASPNIINGAEEALKLQLPLITFSGFSADNPLRKKGAYNFWLDSKEYNIVELVHQAWLLAIVDFIAGVIKLSSDFEE